MTRHAREESADLPHHITVRCLNGRLVIERPPDAGTYVEMLGEVAEKYGWVVVVYCVLSNHVHFIVWTPRLGLGRGMKELQERFAHFANERDGLRGRGHFWSERYDNRLLETQERYLGCIRYVARNAVRHEIVSRIEQWPHGSHHALVGDRPCPPWLRCDLVADAVGGVPAYRAMVERDDRALLDALVEVFDPAEAVRRAVDVHDIPVAVVADQLACSEVTVRRRLRAGRHAAGERPSVLMPQVVLELRRGKSAHPPRRLPSSGVIA